MKIFQVVPYYPPHVGGMEFYVQKLSEELVKRGHEVTVFTSSNSYHLGISDVNGVKVHSLKIMTKVYNVPIVPAVFWKLLSEAKPDVIHTHQYPVFFSDMAAVVSSIRQIPLLIQVHVISDAMSPFSGFISNLYYSTIGQNTLQIADTVIVPSSAYKKKLLQMHIDAKKVHIIPYGIDTKNFQKNNRDDFITRYGCKGSRIILSVGRLNYQKGFHYLIQAMPTILSRIPTAKLVIIGDGEQFYFLSQLVKSLGISASVIFTGALSQEEIPNAYAACDVFALPSLFESFGISLVEAQAAGKPVVATRVGGVPEALVDGKTGFLVAPGNPQQLSLAILHLLIDHDLAEQMGRRGKAFVETHFGIQSVVDSINNCYEAVLQVQSEV